MASTLSAHVQVGYPRRVGQKLFNSVSLVAPDGRTVYTYDKHFLYEADEIWAQEGAGFACVEVDKLGKVGPGICMDINPYQFTAPFEAYEFATFQVQAGATILPVSMAWILSDDESPGLGPAAGTVQYWALRMKPFIEADRQVLFIAANRTGREDATTFAGSSSVLQCIDGEILLLGALGRTEQGVLVVET
ncbi:Carbon-nitrogen hydrolase [Geranomyces michiganensis]|nr:Carbon-nitrogen hydrolase [Geranomyces michiganensis]